MLVPGETKIELMSVTVMDKHHTWDIGSSTKIGIIVYVGQCPILCWSSDFALYLNRWNN